jgi:UDP-4-amino-4,6-dideoxy-N-acetyl-beta-L-altrosamine N-acetyltransferase
LINFTTLELSQKKLVLSWRNHPDIRKWMIQKEEISLDEHLSFIEHLKTQPDKHHFLVCDAENCIGVINLTLIQKNSYELGLYANPEMRGVGTQLMNTLIDYVKELGALKLIANVFITNVRANHLYERFDFKPISQMTRNNKPMMTLERIL